MIYATVEISVLLLLGLIALDLWWGRRYNSLRDQHYRSAAEHKAHQKALFNSVAEGILILDPSDRIILINDSLKFLFSLNADVRGQTVLEAFRLELLAHLVKRLKAERSIRGFELELPRLEDRWLQVNA